MRRASVWHQHPRFHLSCPRPAFISQPWCLKDQNTQQHVTLPKNRPNESVTCLSHHWSQNVMCNIATQPTNIPPNSVFGWAIWLRAWCWTTVIVNSGNYDEPLSICNQTELLWNDSAPDVPAKKPQSQVGSLSLNINTHEEQAQSSTCFLFSIYYVTCSNSCPKFHEQWPPFSKLEVHLGTHTCSDNSHTQITSASLTLNCWLPHICR